MPAFGCDAESFIDQSIFMFKVTYHKFLENAEFASTCDRIITRRFLVY